MLRKLIKKINDIIQWTKKWHFFHVLHVGTFLLTAICDLFIAFVFVTYCILNHHVKNIFRIESLEFVLLCIIICLLISPFTALIATIVEIFVIIKKKIQHKVLSVESPFFIKSKRYNTLYILSFLFNTFCLIWFFRCMLYLM